jgi:4,5-dihydroxyphthalate decarboxylase
MFSGRAIAKTADICLVYYESRFSSVKETMSRLPITIATWDYDRVRALADGRVGVEGCDVNFITMPVEEILERAFFHREFDVAEIGFSPYLIAMSRGIAPYLAIPAFLSRMFRHSAIDIRADRGIEGPADLRNKRVGVPEYQMSAAMWVRGLLRDEFAVAASDINWVQGGLETFGRHDKFPLNLPDGFPLAPAANHKTLSQLLAQGELDAVISARQPSCFVAGHPLIRRLFPDYRAVEQEYYRRRAFSRSCTPSASAGMSWINMPGWQPACTRHSSGPSGSQTRNLPS